ncbi:MAG: type II toxin-antitoxin system PemK/MazF family toxin [Sporichthyaceae bacterium]
MRGDVYELKSIKGAKGHEQQGRRYCVIVQASDLPLSTVLVVPTSQSAKPNQTFRPGLQFGSTTALVDQLTAVDVERSLGRMVGRIPLADLQSIEVAMKLVLEL